MGVEDLRVGPRHRVAARISCWLKDGLHLSSPVGPTGGPMPGYLIWPIGVSVTHQSVPSAPKLSPASGGCWVSHISYRQKPPLAHFHHRLCVFYVRIMQNRSENIGRRFYFFNLSINLKSEVKTREILKILQAPTLYSSRDRHEAARKLWIRVKRGTR